MDKELRINVFKLTSGDIIIGNIVATTETDVTVQHPYSVYDIGQGPCLMPYEMPTLLAAMENITIRLFDIMWNKKLSEFETIEEQYFAATTGIETESRQELIID